MTAGRLPRWVLPAGILMLTAIRLWLTSEQKIQVIAGAVTDDRLYLNLAMALRHGDWLGSYDQLTLAKRPFASIWMAGMNWGGIPLLLSQHLLHVASCLLFLLAIRPLRAPAWSQLSGYALLSFNPAIWSLHWVIRDVIYAGLSGLVLAAATGLLLREERRTAWPWSLSLGLSAGAFWITREESVWILPGLSILVAAALARAWRGTRAQLRSVLARWGVAAVVAAVVVLAVADANRRYYGVFVTSEWTARPFRAGYGALARVAPEPWRAYVPLPRRSVEAAAAQSPAATEIRRMLRSDWVQWTCSAQPELCGELGPLSMWALHEAVRDAGYRTATDVAAFYERLAGEIDAACDAGKLVCGPSRRTLVPPFHSELSVPLMKEFAHSVSATVRFADLSADAPANDGDIEGLRLFRGFTRSPISDSGPYRRYALQGWAFSPQGPITATVVDANGQELPFDFAWQESPDTYEYYAQKGRPSEAARRARFTAGFICPNACGVAWRDATGSRVGEVLAEEKGLLVETERLALGIEKMVTEEVPPPPRVVPRRVRLLDGVLAIYAAFVPIAAGSSIVLVLIVALGALRSPRERLRSGQVVIVYAAIVAALVARWTILALISVSAWPGATVTTSYLMPNYSFVLAAIFMALIIGALSFGRVGGERS